MGTLAVIWFALSSAGVFRPFAVLLLLVVTLGTSHLTDDSQAAIVLGTSFRGVARLAQQGIPRPSGPVAMAPGALRSLGEHARRMDRRRRRARAVECGRPRGHGLSRGRGWAAGQLSRLLALWPLPYSLGLWRFLWETVGLGRTDIVEWQPLHRAPLMFLLLWAMTASLAVLAWRRCGKAAAAPLVPVAALGLLALRVARLEGFFAVASVILLAPCFARLGPQRLPLSRRPTRAEVYAVGALCVIALVATGFAVRRQFGCVTISRILARRAPGPLRRRPWLSCATTFPRAPAVVV